MKKDIAGNFFENRIRYRKFLNFLTMLSLLVFVGVAWKMRMEGITLTDDVQYLCGMESHTHFDGCYVENLVCGLVEGDITEAEQEGHVHTDGCYEVRLICGMEEHQHSLSCMNLNGEISQEDGQMSPVPVTGGSVSDGDAGEEVIENILPDTEELADEEPLDETLIQEMEESVLVSTAKSPMLLAASPTPDQGGRYSGKQQGCYYVVTHLGEKHQDQIHEFLKAFDFYGKAPTDNTVDRGNSNYYLNSPECPYVLFVDDTLKVCVYEPAAAAGQSYGGLSDHWFYCASDEYIGLGTTARSTENGVRRNEIEITAKKPTGSENSPNAQQIFFERWVSDGNGGVRRDGYVVFYVMVCQTTNQEDGRGEDSKWSGFFNHADIEVADGGYYDIVETIKMPDGHTYQVKSHYKTVITGVNAANLYDRSDNLITIYSRGVVNGTPVYTVSPEQAPAFRPTDYISNGQPGESQYELTCQPDFAHTNRHFSKKDIYRAVFDVEVLLKPLSVEAYDENGQLATNFPLANEDRLIQSAEFKFDRFHLEHQSVIDACNKCPNHSGLDFTVAESLDLEMDVDPLLIPIKSSKNFKNGTLSVGQFQYELINSKGVVVGKTTNDVDGNIVFPNQIFLNSGTYDYTVREVIPEGATDLGNHRMLHNGIIYDSNIYPIRVTVDIRNNPDTGAEKKYILWTQYPEYATEKGFTNEVVTTKGLTDTYTDLKVTKIWSDGATKHSDQNVQFRIFQSINGVEQSTPYAYKGQSYFVLSEANDWTTTLMGVPSYTGYTQYAYRIEEVNTPDGYQATVTYKEGVGYVITNTLQDPKLNLQKQWLDAEGNALDSPPQDSITLTLRRRAKSVPVPVTIKLQDTDGRDVTSWVEQAYLGSGFNANIGLTGALAKGTLEGLAVSSNRADAGVSGTLAEDGKSVNLIVGNVSKDLVVTIVCDNKLNTTDIIARYSQDTDEGNSVTGTISGRGVSLAGAWSTVYTTPGGKNAAYKAQGRTQRWNGLIFADPTHLVSGEKYSISAYGRFSNHNDTLNQNTNLTDMSLVMGMYHKEGGTDHHGDICRSVRMSPNEWVHFSNDNYTVPTGTDQSIYFETNESDDNTFFTDFYIDDLIIAQAGVATDVKVNGTQFQYVRRTNPSYLLNVTNKFNEPGSAPSFQEEPAYSKQIVLKAGEDWKKALNASELDEAAGWEYEYYVEETEVPTHFLVSYDNNGVNPRKSIEPIQVTNQKMPSYQLPATGGMGTTKGRMVGVMLIVLSSIAITLRYIQDKKRRSSA